jgi:hypothetical protein
MVRQTKTFDAVETMRRIRDNLSRRFQDMTFAEQKQAMQKTRKSKSTRVQAEKATKRST